MKSKLEPYIDEIVKRYTAGETAKQISETYDVYPDTIMHILRKYRTSIRSKGKTKGSKSWSKGKILVTDEQRVENAKLLFKTGDIFKLQESTIRCHAKRILIATNGNTCSVCGISEWCDKPVPLVCDHIDGDSSNGNFNNFRLVCCNCDAQLPTYKSKNRGNGRMYDRKRYHKIKS
jgi:hypothetical protein